MFGLNAHVQARRRVSDKFEVGLGSLAAFPVHLEFGSESEPAHRYDTCLHHPPHRDVMGFTRQARRRVLDERDSVAEPKRAQRCLDDAAICRDAGDGEPRAVDFFDRCRDLGIVESIVLAAAINDRIVTERVDELRIGRLTFSEIDNQARPKVPVPSWRGRPQP